VEKKTFAKTLQQEVDKLNREVSPEAGIMRQLGIHIYPAPQLGQHHFESEVGERDYRRDVL
jgi:hypothetical protein